MNAMESIKESICVAFCQDLTIRKVPAGLAVSTSFNGMDGDSIGFYVVRSERSPNEFRLEDDGVLIPYLEADGVNLKSGTRSAMFRQILREYSAQYDTKSCVLHTDSIGEKDIAAASLRFLAMMLRLQDLELLSPQTVANTFADDAQKALHEKFASEAFVEANGIVNEMLANYIVDAIIRPFGRDPVAVYFGTSLSKVDESVILRMDANLKHLPLKVVLLLETALPAGIPKRSLARAHNVLDALPVFEERYESMQKIYSVAFDRHGPQH